MWTWEDVKACYYISPGSPGKRFGESQLACPVQPLSPGILPSAPAHSLTHQWPQASSLDEGSLSSLYICPAMNIENILIVLGKVSRTQLILDPPVFPNVFPTLGFVLGPEILSLLCL